MSGHSKWATIKHKKGALDAKRGKLFTKLIKELTVAARMGGGDPDEQPAPAQGDRRRQGASRCPATRSRTPIKRGTGEIEGAAYDEVALRGHRPRRHALPRRGRDRQPQPHRRRDPEDLREEQRQPRRRRRRALGVRPQGPHHPRQGRRDRGPAHGGRRRRRRRGLLRRGRGLDRSRRPPESLQRRPRRAREGRKIAVKASQLAFIPKNEEAGHRARRRGPPEPRRASSTTTTTCRTSTPTSTSPTRSSRRLS